MNAIERILGQLQESDNLVTEKTAEAVTPPAEQQMLDKVREVSESASKTATAETPPAEDLAKMAEEAAQSESERLKKEAHFYGAAICDGFMERAAVYDTALKNIPIKTASEDQIKEATDAAYTKGRTDVEKEASESFEQGYKDQLATVHKTAAEIHLAGQGAAAELIKEARATK